MATSSRTKPSERTVKTLFAKSHNRCAFPGCNRLLAETVNGQDIVYGEICHIEGVNKKAARHNPNRPKETLNDPDNIVLMCHDHHKTIDDLPTHYTVELLKQIKAQHEIDVIEISQQEARYAMLLLEKMKPVRISRTYINSPYFEARDKATQNITFNNKTINVYGRRKQPAVVPDNGTIGHNATKRCYAEYLRLRLIKYLMEMPNYTGPRAGSTVARKLKEKFGATCTHAPEEFFEPMVAFLQAEIDKTIVGRAQKKQGRRAYQTFDEFIKGD